MPTESDHQRMRQTRRYLRGQQERQLEEARRPESREPGTRPAHLMNKEIDAPAPPLDEEGPPLLDGTVLENHGALFDVLVDGTTLRCVLRGKLKKDRQRSVAPVAAGDRVKVAMLEPGHGVIEEVLPRESDLSRRAAGSVPLQQTLVANVDQALIVFAAAEPRTDFFKLDRFLVATVAAKLTPVICINKWDLVDGETLQAQFAVYQRCEFRVLFCSANDGTGLDELRTAMQDRRSIICGPSGVGKSSLLNALAPGLSLRTSDIGHVTHKGRHTTTSIALLELPFGGWVADTPGLRQLAFWEVSDDQLASAFPDLQSYLGRCKYASCKHRQEEGCALQEARAAGLVDARRLQSYLQIARERR